MFSFFSWNREIVLITLRTKKYIGKQKYVLVENVNVYGNRRQLLDKKPIQSDCVGQGQSTSFVYSNRKNIV